ncbi:MAG: hypothetical protein EPO30_00395 [Lysobacteraceae bacterium]|nr:MAG: hypothetical protein EPO30_00395 [Xanthomonadaceae bacterium]
MKRLGTQARDGVMLLGLIGVVVLAYFPGLHGGFVFDDYPNIVDNLALHVRFDSGWHAWLAAIFSSPSSELLRPLAMLSFAVNHALTGLDPYWMKLTNLGIHLLNTVLVFVVVRRLLHAGGRRDTSSATGVALWISAAWALNPINLMAVLLVVQRMESLCHAFVFAGLWLYLAGRERLHNEGRGWPMLIAGIVGATFLGALVKESALLLPVYALAIEWILLQFATKGHETDRRLLVLFGVLALPAIIWLAWLLPGLLSGAAYAGRDFSLSERLLTEGRVLIDYLHWTLLPDLSQLSLYHDDYVISDGLLSPPSTLFAWVGLALLGAAAVLFRSKRPLLALGIAWFLAAQALTATVIPLELMYEHRNYFASLGVCMVLGDVLLLAPRTMTLRRAGLVTAGLLLVLHAGLTGLRAREWSDPLRFASTEAAKHPQSPRATYDLARDLIIITGYRRDSNGIDQAFSALERAMAVPGATPMPEAAAIVLASRTARPVEPRWWYRLQDKLKSGAVGPQQINAIASLVNCQLEGACQLPPQAMLDTFDAALRAGRHPEVLSIYGNYALNAVDDPTLAFALWREAAERAPSVAQYQISMAKLLIASGQPALAEPYIEALRKSGSFGQNEIYARELEQLAASKTN